FTGELTSVDNAIDSVTRSVKVRATLPNRDGALKTGMFMSVALMSKDRQSLAIPEISVVAEGSKTYVFTVAEGKAKKTEVTLGARERGVVEVVSGLNSGDMVVTDGVLKVRPGAPVKVQAAPPPALVESDSLDGGGDPRLAAGEGPSDKAGLR